MIIILNKPFNVLSQFTPEIAGQRTLAEFGLPKTVWPLGRLDADSEGLLLLSDEPELNKKLLHPDQRHLRTYWAQVERIPSMDALEQLRKGVEISSPKERFVTLLIGNWIL
jgi:23S rRNA pseudouridine2457 synthase